MTDTSIDPGALVTWSAAQCPFVIEYSRKTLDDIRLAVVDAFFSLPRGGAEIGGILLGRFDDQRLQILDYAPLESEHAFGPAFTLSPQDQKRLAEMLAEAQNHPGGLRPVGWYHSHTRSEISLCAGDLEIHNRYFPDRWQVALVLRPSTLQPAQAGFFFREPDGSIHAQSSYQEFALDALPVRQMPTGIPEAVAGPMRETEPDAVVITLPAAEPVVVNPPSSEPEPLATEELPAEQHAEPQTEQHTEPYLERTAAPVSESELPATGAHEVVAIRNQLELVREPSETMHESAAEPEEQQDPPASTLEAEPKRGRRWVGIAAGLIVGLGLGAVADQARSRLLPQASAPAPQGAAKEPGPAQPRVALASVQAPEDAALRKRNEELGAQNVNLSKQVAQLSEQNDGLRKQNAELAQQQAESSKQQASGGKQQAEVRQQRDDLVKQTAKLKAELSAQTSRSQSLQQQLDELRRQQQKRRLNAQSSEPLP